MVHHIILWKLKETLSGDEKKKVLSDIKENLEALKNTVETIETIEVKISNMDSSNVDVMLNSTFATKDALDAYQKHPDHQNAANTYVRPFTEIRSCIDFED